MIIRADIGDVELTLLSFLVKKMEIDFNMFHARMEDQICTKIGGANIVAIYGWRSIDSDGKFDEK